MLCLNLPRTEYSTSLDIQNAIVNRMMSQRGRDVLILVEHPPTVTLGVRGTSSHLLVGENELEQRGVSLHRVNRGGEATYHGPGQLVAYPVMDLRTRGLSARDYVNGLEETIIRALASFGVKGFRKPKAAGVWTSTTGKIASVGVRIQQRITSHGFSLNVSMAAHPEELVVVCGAPGIRMINLCDLARVRPSMVAVRHAVRNSFCQVFGGALEECSVETAVGPV